jgi:hypothetical protein
MFFYGLKSEAYLTMDIESLSPENLKELAYYLWCFYPNDDQVMTWRKLKLLPRIENLSPPDTFEEYDLDG